MKRVATTTSPAPRPRFTRRPGLTRRPGFTLIEMLVVIGIILLLLTIGVVGYRSMERGQMEKATKTILANADAFNAELRAVGSVALIEGPADASPPPLYQTPPPAQLGSPGAVGPTGGGRELAILHNQNVVRKLIQNPKNKTAIANLPTASLLPPLSSFTTSLAGFLPYDSAIPVLTDGWGNPMIFVPSGGLTGVKVGGSSNQTITSTAQASSPQNRGFWASAGPDGNFTEGDDNVYSFQK